MLRPTFIEHRRFIHPVLAAQNGNHDHRSQLFWNRAHEFVLVTFLLARRTRSFARGAKQAVVYKEDDDDEFDDDDDDFGNNTASVR